MTEDTFLGHVIMIRTVNYVKRKNLHTRRRQEIRRAAGLQDLHLSGALRRFLLPHPSIPVPRSLPPPPPPPAGCQEPQKTKLKEALSCLCGEKTSREQEVFEKLHVWWNFSAVAAAAVHRDGVWSGGGGGEAER